MAYSPDPEEWSNNDWVDREFVDYELNGYERRSLDTITKNLDQEAYKDYKDCFAHMQFLEHLSNKLKEVISNERSIGKANWDIERAHKEIRTLYDRLNDEYRRLRKK